MKLYVKELFAKSEFYVGLGSGLVIGFILVIITIIAFCVYIRKKAKSSAGSGKVDKIKKPELAKQTKAVKKGENIRKGTDDEMDGTSSKI